uniref:Uncharacterized protein n=1 Tax=viral metagenome TaxID=1070528 RepID=A0A6M3KD05_9ZZZZ
MKDDQLKKDIIECHNIAKKNGFWDFEEQSYTLNKLIDIAPAFVAITNLIETERGADTTDYECPCGEEDVFIDSKLLLIATEISEALNKTINAKEVFEELADIYIRLMDLIGYIETLEHYDGSDFCTVLREKIETNKKRPYRHDKKC